MAMERHLTDKTDSSLSSASRQALRLPRCRLVRDGVVSLEMSMWQGATRMWRVAPPPRLPRCDRRPVWPMCRPVRDFGHDEKRTTRELDGAPPARSGSSQGRVAPGGAAVHVRRHPRRPRPRELHLARLRIPLADVTNPLIFRVGTVEVDNERLRSNAARTVDVLGGRARILSYSVPRNLRQTVGHTVEFQVLVRKYIGDERRVRVQTQLFRSVTDAEFRMTVDPTLGVERLFTAASEVSAIGVARGGSAESTFVEPFDQHAGIVRLPFPLQAGSSVAFTLDCIGETS